MVGTAVCSIECAVLTFYQDGPCGHLGSRQRAKAHLWLCRPKSRIQPESLWVYSASAVGQRLYDARVTSLQRARRQRKTAVHSQCVEHLLVGLILQGASGGNQSSLVWCSLFVLLSCLCGGFLLTFYSHVIFVDFGIFVDIKISNHCETLVAYRLSTYYILRHNNNNGHHRGCDRKAPTTGVQCGAAASKCG